MAASTRLGLIGLLVVANACGDDEGREPSGTSAGPASNSLPTLTLTMPGDSESDTQSPTGGTGNNSQGMTGTADTGVTLTEPGVTSTGPDTGPGTNSNTNTMTDSSGAMSTGPDLLCSPNSVSCVDDLNYQTCAGDGMSWMGPTPCGGKLVCSGGLCLGKCEAAGLSSIGCEYYAVDANNDPVEGYDAQPYAVAISNIDPALAADVKIEAFNNGVWEMVAAGQVMPKQLSQFMLPDRHVDYTNFNARGAYRVTSDIPIIAYQFQPITGETSYTSDASLLLPSTAYDTFYYVLGWGKPSYGNGQINIVAAEDGTTVTITSTTTTQAGGPIPALSPGVPTPLPLMNEADVIQIEGLDRFAGTYITSDKPIAVFSTHWCANVPDQQCCCDHLEEQLYGLQKWGTSYVASRWPVRSSGVVEASYWHIIAAEDNTTVNFVKHAEVTGIAQPQMVMSKGQVVQLEVGGSVANPGDFVVTSDKPVFMMQYLSSSGYTNVAAQQAGDPAMAQAIPSEQYRSDYVVLVPTNWTYDFFTITKKVGDSVNLDGVPIDQGQFVRVGPAEAPSEWEVARISVTDGVHALDGTAPFGVIVLGYDEYDSYAYPGGLDQKQINPQ